ncbi:MAG: Hint domain-containing protein [Candidatus Pacearchaeota archaeon]
MRLESFILSEGINDKGIFKSMFMAGHPGCFDENTLIKTENGYKRISDISINENIFTLNEKTNEIELKPVLDVFVYDDHQEDILEITFDNGETIICTENHQFFVDGKWVKAKDLE